MEKFTIQIGDKTLTAEIGNLAQQANGEVLVRYGDTEILTTAVMSEYPREGIDFLPLSVEYQERFYAAGKIKGPRYIRREGRPSDEAILVSRLVDRTIRPLFLPEIRQDIQVILTVLSWDGENDPDVLAIFGASLALGISDIPWNGPVAGVRIGINKESHESRIRNQESGTNSKSNIPARNASRSDAGGRFIVNPTYEEREKNGLDLIIAGCHEENHKSQITNHKQNTNPKTQTDQKSNIRNLSSNIQHLPIKDRESSTKVGATSNIYINMFEGSGNEVKEEIILETSKLAQEEIKKLIDFQKEIIKKCGKEKTKIEIAESDKELKKEVKEFLKGKLEKALYEKFELPELKKDLIYYIQGEYDNPKKNKETEILFEEELENVLVKNILEKEKRPDGRKLTEIRPIEAQVGILPRTHGSGIFKRGQTQSLSILTLGAPGDVQLLEGMEIVGKKRFMHHYNFPPYCVGETGPIRGPGRREIGHGTLAEKSLKPLVPDYEEFPYTIRVVSEILSSNGSSSMASVCSSSLALADGGVPIKEMVSGIAMGLIINDKCQMINDKFKNYKILTDIQGPEDHYGDMDLKIAGTKNGITSVQMDVKIRGINIEILKNILEQGKKARLEILEQMKKIIANPRKQLSPYAPRILTLQINPQKIREVIGPGGKIINEITAETGVSIDIEDSGMISITSESEEMAKKAIDWIKNITREAKIGERFSGKVKKILDFGAFIEILPGQDGLLHISKIVPRPTSLKAISDKKGFPVKKIEDIMKVGDIIPVKVIGIDQQGKISLEKVEAEKR